MCYHNYCGALVQVEVCKEFYDFLFVLAVEVSCWFIGKYEGGVVG